MERFLASNISLIWRGFPRHYCGGQASQTNLSQLRKRTGVPLKNCRAALQKFHNNLEEAEKWLTEQAQKEGWARADKLQSRPMSQGLLGLMQSRTGATMIEVNCETDFVARNEKFQNLVYHLTIACHNNLEKDANKKVLQHEAVNTLPSEDKMLSDIVAQEVGTIGENMRLRRAVFLPNSNGHILSSYVHNSDKLDQLNEDNPKEYWNLVASIREAKENNKEKNEKDKKVVINGCHLGRFGTILSIGKASRTEVEDSVEELTKGLCQHIIASSPTCIGSLSDKPSANKQEETRLLFQEYALNEDVAVKEILEENDVTLNDFVRFECGEILPDENA